MFDLIEEAYRVFDTYKPNDVEVCTTCCMDAAIAADFFKPDIRDLPLEYLSDWYGSAYSPDGVGRHIWTYLLPRVLEVLAAGENPSNTGIELVFDRYDTGKPDQWSGPQWEILDRFQRVFVVARLPVREDWPGSVLDDTLCMFRRGGWPLHGLMEQLENLPTSLLATRLWCDWCSHRADGGTINMSPFWHNPERDTVYGFYTSEGLRSRLESLALADETPFELANMASRVVEVIEMH